MDRYICALTGASGSLYGLRVARELASSPAREVHIIVSRAAEGVIAHETGISAAVHLRRIQDGAAGRVVGHEPENLFAPPASGTFRTAGMAIVPCSSRTLGQIAGGAGQGLLPRAAEVTMKERRRLVVVPRETPVSVVHVRNMLILAEAGAVVLPASPGFYHHPNTVEDLVAFVAGKVLDALGVEHNLYPEWGDVDVE
jgi:4-hydroxy-3-polyprenylbenzoate decarboxylase